MNKGKKAKYKIWDEEEDNVNSETVLQRRLGCLQAHRQRKVHHPD